MNQLTLPQRFTTGQSLWLIIAVALGLALGSQAATAKECHRETPLPADVRLMAPGPEVPEAVARFAGAWNGASEGMRSSDPLCHTLVVEEVFANGYPRVIYSYSSSVYWGIRLPGFLRATGRIIDGELRFQVPIRERPQIAYRVVGETLEGTFSGPDGVIRLLLSRMPDLSQVGCGQQAGWPPLAPPVSGRRDQLTAAELRAADSGTGPVHTAYFLPVGQLAPALHAFQGTLTIEDSTMFQARHGCGGDPDTLRGFSVAFFNHGEHLVPVVRDLMAPPGMIFSPGRIWSEPSDGGLSRASFPFVLTNPDYNATHNGLATFLYDDSRVSALRFQVVQETASWAKFDGWGQTPLTYTPGPIANEDALRAEFAAEIQQQTPIQPWSALPAAALSASPQDFDSDTAPEDVSVSGLIIDAVILSFWSVPYRTATGCVFQIPYMMGFGGNLVVLLPNGISAFRFADGHHYNVDTMVLAGEAMRPFPCAVGSAETPPARQLLSASALRAELRGNTFYADSLNRFPGSLRGHLTMFVAADGMQYGRLKTRPDAGAEHDVGTWHITPDGHFCNTWHVWRSRRERCFAVYREGETFELYPQDRLGKDAYRRVLGNPEGY